MEPEALIEAGPVDESLMFALGLNDDWWEPEFVVEIDLDFSECERAVTKERDV